MEVVMEFIGSLTECVKKIEIVIQRKLSVVECGELVKQYFRTFNANKTFFYNFTTRGNVYNFKFKVLGT